jgi:hypothetical protein
MQLVAIRINLVGYENHTGLLLAYLSQPFAQGNYVPLKNQFITE